MSALRKPDPEPEINYGFEPIRSLSRDDRFRELAEAHWLEVAEDQDEFPLDIRWTALILAEMKGELKIMTARADDGTLVGYLSWLLNFDPMYGALFAYGSPLYVDPAWRGHWIGVNMARHSEPELQRVGVRRAHIWGNKAHPIGPIPRRLGYRPYEESWVKVL